MKYFMVIAKCGHVGKNNYYKGNLFIKAESRKEAARIAREVPRVKHDRKDAILDVLEIDLETFENGRSKNHEIHYFTSVNRQEQNRYLHEIEDSIYMEESMMEEASKNYKKKHSLRKIYNADPTYDIYKRNKKLMSCELIA